MFKIHWLGQYKQEWIYLIIKNLKVSKVLNPNTIITKIYTTVQYHEQNSQMLLKLDLKFLQ